MSAFDDMGASTQIEICELFKGGNRELAAEMITLVQQFRSYWPMTLRAFYYQAVSALLVPNSVASYRKIGTLLKKLRRADLVPWYAMEDKTRSTSDKRGRPDVSSLIEQHMSSFLHPNSYQRCYIQTQDVYVELSVEKDALSTRVIEAAMQFCTRVNVVRGQVSATMLNDMAQRFDSAIMKGREPILLHFGDLDPSGIQIPKSMQSGMYEHHMVDVDVRQIALTPEQCDDYDLPQSLDAAKEDDPNIDRWYAEYGDQSPTELDALHPEDLMSLVKESLEDVYDMDELGEQEAKEEEERKLLKKMRNTTFDFLTKEFPEYMEGIKP